MTLKTTFILTGAWKNHRPLTEASFELMHFRK